MINKLKEYIIDGKFIEAEEMIQYVSCEELENILYNLAYDSGSICPYSFACYLAMKEKQAEYHYIASIILSMGLNHLSGSYHVALFHAREALKLEPNLLKYKEYLLFFYHTPDELLSHDEAISLSKEILLENSKSEIALNIINKSV